MTPDVFKRTRMLFEETLSSFRRNNDLAAASSLAFSSSLALIPALFLVTTVLGAAVGSSQEAAAKVQEILRRFFPAYSEVMLREVRTLAAYKGAIGLLNFLVLMLGVMPLVSNMRQTLGGVFRRTPGRSRSHSSARLSCTAIRRVGRRRSAAP